MLAARSPGRAAGAGSCTGRDVKQVRDRTERSSRSTVVGEASHQEQGTRSLVRALVLRCTYLAADGDSWWEEVPAILPEGKQSQAQDCAVVEVQVSVSAHRPDFAVATCMSRAGEVWAPAKAQAVI